MSETPTQESTPESEDDIAAAGDGALCSGHSFWASSGNRFPSGTLVVYRNRIAITDKWPQRVIEVPRERVLAIRKSFLGGKFQIVHNVADLPPYLTFGGGFGVTNFILEGLERFGYPITKGRTPVPSGVRPRLSWKPIAGPVIAAVWALVLAFLYRNRLLPSLSQPRILSGGKEISTADFSRSMAHMLTISAVVFALLAIVFLFVQLWMMKQQRSANESSPRKAET